MATLTEDLRSLMRANSTISAKCATRVHYNVAPDSYTGSYIWFTRSGTENEKHLSESGGNPFTHIFDVEVHSFDDDDTEDIAAALHTLDGHRGTIGTGTVQGVFVESQSDDYEPRGLGEDEGLHSALLRITVMGYTAG